MHGKELEPVAVIGIGCRFAGGADTPGQFWDLLVNGRHGIGDMPTDRWRIYSEAGPDYAAAVRKAGVRGGFLPDVEGFDAGFFGLTPREAELMDPQQRLLLELAWEALEHAGIPPGRLAGGDTGVFVGVGSDDYGRRLLEHLPTIEAWTGIGGAMCAVANRISYALDLHGPSLAVDTACSASLVATHLACQSLRAGESGLALVGGVNLIISPGLNLTLAAAGATAPDGRCKPFDADADGYGRGEGGGVIVLKRLGDALRDGDRVLSVIRGSAVNQDGRTNGIMAPSGTAQRDLLVQACHRAGVTSDSVGYVEAHGTGTRLGDPLEAGALSAVYGQDRPEPCLIGSVKSNIGHLEAGAGVASLIKATLALANEEIPPSLGFTTGNPRVDWARSGLRVVTERTAWSRGDQPRRAGVSGFGYGGTIAHVVLEEAPQPATVDTGEAGRLFPLSASSEKSLRDYASALADHLTDGTPLASVGHTLAERRTHLRHRAAVIAHDHDELRAGLRLIAGGEQSRTAVSGVAPAQQGTGLVWVFSGHGSQWLGMGRQLLDHPVFAAAIDELAPVFAEEIGFTPRQVLRDADFETVDRIQTMIFAMQVGLAAVWRSHGVEPDAVIGHSVGEIAAAVVSGALTVHDGARLICRRSKLLREVAGDGAMAMTSLPFEDVVERLGGRDDVVAAIWASPVSTVVSGDVASIEALIADWAADDVQLRRVSSDVAFHSPQMDPLLARLAAAGAELSPRRPDIPVYSTALPDPRSAELLDGCYWAANLRNPVRLAAATLAAVEDGYRTFIEVSAHPVVAHSIGETLAEHGIQDAFVGTTLRRDQPEAVSLLAALAAAHCHGVEVNWRGLQPAGDLVDLPPVAWQREPHWHEVTIAGGGQGAGHDPASHNLLGSAVPIAGQPLALWRTQLDDANRPYPGSHTIAGTEILPAAILVNTFLAAAGENRLTDVSLRLPLSTVEPRELQVHRDGTVLRLASRALQDDSTWVVHATATVGVTTESAPPSPTATPVRADPGDVLAHLASVGVPTMAFDWTVREFARGDGVVHARVATGEQPTWASLLDAALSIAPLAYPGAATLRMVAGAGRVTLDGSPPPEADVRVVFDQDVVDVVISTVDGEPVGRLAGLRYAGMADDIRDLVHELVWRPLSTSGDRELDLVLVGAESELVAAIRATGVPCRVVRELTDLAGATDVVVLPPEPGASVPEAAVTAAWRLLSTAHGLADGPRLWALTTGVLESEDETAVAQSPVWGLGRVLAGEHDEFWGGVIDLPSDLHAVAVLLDVLRTVPADDVIVIRDGVAKVARLRPTERVPEGNPVTCRPDGTYLVTGGLGVLGLEVADWLADRGARRLVLAGRRPLPPRHTWHDCGDERVRRIRALEARGVTVRVVSLDIADVTQTAGELAALDLPPILGVVHAAGVLDNRLARDTDEHSLRDVLSPKVAGAWTLHMLFPPGSLDFLVLFSSCGYLLGLPGQAAYGSANAFLDALAAHRPDTVSFGWTSWRTMGMARNDIVDRELKARGVTDISRDEAFEAWDHVARLGTGHFPVFGVTDPDGIEPLPILSEITATRPVVSAVVVEDSFTGLPPAQLRERLLVEVGAQIAGEMRMPASALDVRRSLVEQGLDSVLTMVVRRRLEKRFGQKLPTTLLWHQPSVSAIADHLVEAMLTGS